MAVKISDAPTVASTNSGLQGTDLLGLAHSENGGSTHTDTSISMDEVANHSNASFKSGINSTVITGVGFTHGLVNTPVSVQVTPTEFGVTSYFATVDATNVIITFEGIGPKSFNWFVSSI